VVKCRARKKGRYAPQVHMTETREITLILMKKRSRRLAPANYDSERSAVLIGHLR
jgi:hypothetical protein